MKTEEQSVPSPSAAGRKRQKKKGGNKMKGSIGFLLLVVGLFVSLVVGYGAQPITAWPIEDGGGAMPSPIVEPPCDPRHVRDHLVTFDWTSPPTDWVKGDQSTHWPKDVWSVQILEEGEPTTLYFRTVIYPDGSQTSHSTGHTETFDAGERHKLAVVFKVFLENNEEQLVRIDILTTPCTYEYYTLQRTAGGILSFKKTHAERMCITGPGTCPLPVPVK